MLISKSIFLFLHSNKVTLCESKFKIIFVYASLGFGACMFITCLEISTFSDIIEIQVRKTIKLSISSSLKGELQAPRDYLHVHWPNYLTYRHYEQQSLFRNL